MEFKDKVLVVTGGAQGIGKCISEEFQKAGATVCVVGNLWTSLTRCSTFAPTKQDSSQARTSALTVA